jgi:hypothetical protein
MMRIATRLVSLASLGLLTFGLASACASEQTAFPASSSDASVLGVGGAGGGGNGQAGAMTGGCDKTFCPAGAMGVGNSCCLSAAGPCGVDYGMGCVEAVTPTQPHKDGG